MILPDINVLVYAYRAESERHEAYAEWLGRVVAGQEELALVDTVLTGFARIVTNPRIYADPAPTSAALTFVERLIAGPRSTWLPEGGATWARLRALVEGDAILKGDRVPDAYLAAVALTHGIRLATADRGFARYPGLRSFHPLDDITR